MQSTRRRLDPAQWKLIRFEPGTRKKINAVLMHKKTGKIVRLGFGQKGSTTYWDKTGVGGDPIHQDPKRRKAYQARHAGEGSPRRKWSPGFLSWWWLW